MIKGMIKTLNVAMYAGEISFDCVRDLLAQLSKLTGKEYDIVNRRVIVKDEYGKIHDAYVWA